MPFLFLSLGPNVPRPQGRGDPLLQDMPTSGMPTLPSEAHPQRAQNHTGAQCLPGPQGEDPPTPRLRPFTSSHLLLTAGFCQAGYDAHLFLPPQDKLTKTLTYILGNQDTVQTQICELEETVRHTEVRESIEVALGPTWAWKPQAGVARHGPITWLQAQEVWGPWMC